MSCTTTSWRGLYAAALLCCLPGCATTTPPAPCAPCVCPATGAASPGAAVGAASAVVKPAGQGSPSTAQATEQVSLRIFAMSKCPYASQVENELVPLIDALGLALDLRLEYIVSEEQGKLNAMHGPAELKGNQVQLCAQQHYSTRRFAMFLACQNRTFKLIPDNWRQCAADLGLDQAALETCLTSGQGERLQRASMAQAKAVGAEGSPTIYVGDKLYKGGRTKLDLMRAICAAYSAQGRPAACAKLPQPVMVSLVALTDSRCKKCDVTSYITVLRGRLFPGLKARTVDYGTPEGKQLFRDAGLKRLPALLLEPGVEQAPKFKQVRRWLVRKGKYYALKVPANFDPTAEICDNKVDDTGNGKLDCADPTCRGKLVCRPQRRRQVDVFIMSQCPFAAKGVLAMKEVLANFPGKLRFNIHYIATLGQDGSFSALHGHSEVDENIRQLCAREHYGKRGRHLRYTMCRMQDYRSDDWKKCAVGGISARVIERCASGPQGKRLLARDIKLAQLLNISASPTWLANNRHRFSGVTAEAIKVAICKHNPGLKGCDKGLSDKADVKGSCGN